MIVEFEGRNALVTGASRGIGRACAVELARQGANVAMNYLTHQDEAEAVAAEVESFGRSALLLPADVADQPAVEKMIARTANAWGHLDLFVSNAALSQREPMIEANMDSFRRTIDVTMWGAFHGVRACAQQMVRQRNGGAIVVVSSPHATHPIANSMAYNMSKAAIDHMARTAAVELAPHRIRVNIVHPGWIDTPGERKFYTEEQIAEGAKKLPWKRLGRPEEIAKTITFLLSRDTDYMTGATLVVDGGITVSWSSHQVQDLG